MLCHEIRGNIHLIGRGRKVAVADESVDVLSAEARIFYGIGAGLHVEAEGCPIRNSPLRCVSDSHYRVFILQTYGSSLLLLEVVYL